MRNRKTCLECLDYYGCTRMNLKPSIGECSVNRTDIRHEALEKIADKVKRKGTAFLKHPVSVTEDFCGMDFDFTVRSVSLGEGTRAEALDFTVGTNSYGEKVSTGNLRTRDLVNIANEI